MSLVLDGMPASEGIGSGKVFILNWGVPVVPHRTVPVEAAASEVARFHEARAWATRRLTETKARTEERLGRIEARIFDPQILMLDDPAVVDGTVRYIEENRLSAERAFEWRMLELQAMWSRTSHPMVLDRLNDLEDLMTRVLNRLLGNHDPTELFAQHEDVIIVAPNLTPSLTVHLDAAHVAGIATDQGTRTAHWAILARSLKIPAVVGLNDISKRAREGQFVIVDGRFGRVVLDPDVTERDRFRVRSERLKEWEGEISVIAELEPVTKDGQFVDLRANLDQPEEGVPARLHGADGVGLFRTEFLVVGRNTMPGEDEQFEAYKTVAQSFPGRAVYIRTFDLGGDKFPIFLHMPQEENPFLGWRAIRVCLDEPELFRTQLRALLRATPFGDLRLMLPLINDVEEIRRVREMLSEEEDRLDRDGIEYRSDYQLGIMIETPAAALDAVELARHSDFFSIGTNDLVQYTLAVDRTNTRLANLYNPFHPSVLRQLDYVAKAGRAAGIEVSVCGELAANPLAAFLMLGLDITALSMAWPSLPEIKKFIRDIRVVDAHEAANNALAAPSSQDVIRALAQGVGDSVDLKHFQGRWSLSLTE
jgi:phosphoenolpyruvate-protein phosphotransferase (PTS system enzyme I)